MGKIKIGTVWLGGCSGCHMSFLDLDERLIELAQVAEIMSSPITDWKLHTPVKEYQNYPEVDVTLVEGAVVNTDNVEVLKLVRERSKILVAFGDCAVTGNIPSYRNLFKVEDVLNAVYIEKATYNHQIPSDKAVVPTLLKKVVPISHIVKVDLFIPGCPPSADSIWYSIKSLLEGKKPEFDKEHYRYG
ncbi:MAG: oxidoreductase [Brevinematia bacterium]